MDTSTLTGKMIAVEGIEGAGKTSVLQAIETFLQSHGKATWLTREPGGTPTGESLRDVIKRNHLQPTTELLLLYASRHELLHQVIVPKLACGTWVISDRFELSSFAYQGAGRGLSDAMLQQLSSWCLSGFRPNITFYLDVPYAVSQQRVVQRGEHSDRFEQQGQGFFERVRQHYLCQAQQCDDVHWVDATQTQQQVVATIARQLEQLL